MIKKAAIKKDNVLYIGEEGQRHHHILQSKPLGFLRQGRQGFVDENNKFYSREEAAKHAFECKQIKELKLSLFSEDLW